MPLYELEGVSPKLAEDGSNWIAPSADLIGDVQLGKDASVWFNAVIRADNSTISIGDRSNIQDGSVLHSDHDVPLTVGADCIIGHQVMLHSCTIGNNVLVGMGATILNNAEIGDFCLIGANALITEGKTFPPYSMILGSPAKVVRQLGEKEIELLKRGGQGYVDNQRRFAKTMKRVD